MNPPASTSKAIRSDKMPDSIVTPRPENYTSTADHLLPCPFCGRTPRWYLTGNDFTPKIKVTIKCGGCRVGVGP